MKKSAMVLLSCLALSCCDQRTRLPHGYQYVSLDSVNSAISDSNNIMVIYPNIKEYKILGEYIVGERVKSDIDKRFSTNLGFFIFDTRDGTLLQGLSDTQFETELRVRSIGPSPF